MATEVQWEGVDTLVGILHNLKPNTMHAVENLMVEVSYDVFDESQKEVPVRFGILKASGHVDDPIVSNDDVTINIGYGGAAAEYAYFVHENVAAYHTPPTKAKFLEGPMSKALMYLERRVYRNSIEGAILGNFPGAPTRRARAEGAAFRATNKRPRRAMTREQVEQRLKEMRGR